jgi:HAMP domain-containing protein
MAGARAGLVVVALDLGWLSKRMASLQWRPQQAISVVDRDGLFLIRHPEHEHYVGTQFPHDMWDKVRNASEPGAYEVPSPLDSITRIVGFIPPHQGPAGFYVAVGESSSEAFGYLNDVMWRSVVLLFLGLALALILAWIFGDRLIRQPINRLVAATQRWRGGDFTARSGLQGDTEFGQLGASFDAMASELQNALEYKDTLLREVMGGGQCTVEADQLLLSPDQAMPLALIVNELITNAIKHGAANTAVTVKLGRSNAGVRVAVRNHGALPIGYEPSAAPGFGMSMVLGMVRQLDGRLEASSMADEVEFAVTFKASLAQPAPLKVVEDKGAAPGPTAA